MEEQKQKKLESIAKANQFKRKQLEDFEEKIIMDHMRGEVNRELAETLSRQLDAFQSKLRILKELSKTIKFYNAMRKVGIGFRVKQTNQEPFDSFGLFGQSRKKRHWKSS